MKPSSSSSSILRSLSLPFVRLSASSAVNPLPATTSFDHQLTCQRHTLHSQNDNNWLLQALDASTTTQQITLQSLPNVTYQHSDRKIIDDYLDFNVKMLDTCNDLTDRIHAIQHYVESLKVVLHLLQAGGNYVEPHPTTLARARELLDSCQAILETRRCNKNQSSALKRFFSQKLSHQGGHQSDSKLEEVLSGSKAVTSMVCEILVAALSSKSKSCELPILAQAARSVSCWSTSLQQLQKHVKEHTKSGSSMMMMVELRQTMEAARDLRLQLKSRNLSNLRYDVEELKRRYEELEEGIIPFESKVKELYKHLISVRMALLGVLSHL